MATLSGDQLIESVWDYPRPPRIEDVPSRVRITVAGVVIADSVISKRVLETSHPPSYYLPPQDVTLALLSPSARSTMCEWKGPASYFDLRLDGRIYENAAWQYAAPTPDFLELEGFLAFYCTADVECYVGNEKVKPEGGRFYGGWVTSNIVGLDRRR